MSRKGEAQTTGSAIGQEEKRSYITEGTEGFDNVCPFGYYFLRKTSGKHRGKTQTALERYNYLDSIKREVATISVMMRNKTGKTSELCAKLIMSICFAQTELSYYNKEDVVVLNSNRYRKEIHDRLSKARQYVGLNSNASCSNNRVNKSTLSGSMQTGRSFGNK